MVDILEQWMDVSTGGSKVAVPPLNNNSKRYVPNAGLLTVVARSHILYLRRYTIESTMSIDPDQDAPEPHFPHPSSETRSISRMAISSNHIRN